MIISIFVINVFKMVAVITGDVVNSRGLEPQIWLDDLKLALNGFGDEPSSWFVFRGDSFQLEVDVMDALLASLLIKSTLKQHKNIDVRLAIGIGEVSYKASIVAESNGSAYVNSGESFDALKKQKLTIKSPWKNFDRSMNIILHLATFTIDGWTTNMALIVNTLLLNPKTTQKELALKLDKKQSNISLSLKNAGFIHLKQILKYYSYEIKRLC